MAGQQVNASYDPFGDVEPRHGGQARAAQHRAGDTGRIPAQADGRGESADGRPGHHGHGHGRRAAPPRRTGRLPAVVPAVGLPLLGAVAGELTGSRLGAVFAVLSVLGAALAALVCSGAGLWWVVTITPLVVLVGGFGVDYLAHGDDYRGTLLATHGLRLVGHAFPVMGAAAVAALLMIVVRRVRSGRGRRG